jgi:hypothetical protein
MELFDTTGLVQKYRVEWHLTGAASIRQSTVTVYGRDPLRSVNAAIVRELCTRTGHWDNDIVLDQVTER